MTDPSIVAQGYGAVYDAMPRRRARSGSPTLLRQLVAASCNEGASSRIISVTLAVESA
jgi:hypothetical protein